MAIYDQHMKAMGLLEGFVPFQPAVEVMDEMTDGFQVDQAKDPPYGVSTGQILPQAPPPKTIAPVLLQGMQTPHPGKHHDERTRKYDRCLDRRPSPPVGDTAEENAKLIELLYIAEETPENRLPLSL